MPALGHCFDQLWLSFETLAVPFFRRFGASFRVHFHDRCRCFPDQSKYIHGMHRRAQGRPLSGFGCRARAATAANRTSKPTRSKKALRGKARLSRALARRQAGTSRGGPTDSNLRPQARVAGAPALRHPAPLCEY